MKTKYNIKDYEKLDNLDNSSEDTIKLQNNLPNNLKLLVDKNISSKNFFNKYN